MRKWTISPFITFAVQIILVNSHIVVQIDLSETCDFHSSQSATR
jgi:hypothetical protein